MKAFYGSRFSENMTKTPDEFLICHNVPIARSGWYEYLGQEIGAEGMDNKIVKVYRSPEEVFSKQAISSFEGKIVTDEHPPDLLNPKNAMLFTKGTVQNVRKSVEEPDLLLADLIIYDSTLIDEIEQGKREVSCGYECNYKENDNGTYNQVQICGNHVAVVEAGRAGGRVAIKDSKIKEVEGAQKMSKKMKIPTKKRPVSDFLAAVGLKHFATDAEPDELAGVVDELTTERNCETDEETVPEKTPEQKPSNDEESNPAMAALTEQVNKLTNIVTTFIETSKKEKKPEDVIDEMIGELSKDEDTVGDEENSVTIPVEEMKDEDLEDGEVSDPSDRPENPIKNKDSAAMLLALNAMKPIIANMSNPTEKKKACDSLITEFNKIKQGNGNNGYAQIIKTQRKNAASKKKAADAKLQRNVEAIGEGYKKYNPHYNKEVK